MIPPHLHSVEISSLIPNCQGSGTGTTNCDISTPQGEVTNNGYFSVGGDVGININARIDTFINYGTIYAGLGNQTFAMGANGYIGHFINYGTMEPNYQMMWIASGSGIGKITNYGAMGPIEYGKNMPTLTIDNYGIIWYRQYFNIKLDSGSGVLIQSYTIKIDESATKFNRFDGNVSRENSHLVISNGNYSDNYVIFKDKNSKIFLDFGENFEFGKEYAIGKVVTDTGGQSYPGLGVDFSRLSTRNDIYSLSQSGDNFVVSMKPQYGTMGTLYKVNIKSMNNLYLQSNSMIYPHKFAKKRVVKKKRVIRRVKKISALDFIESLESLESNESFAYKSNSNNLNNPTNQNGTNHNTTRRRITTTNRTLSNQNDKYYFVLTPFVAHNYFFEQGRYNLSGLEYGFITAFSGKLTQNNALGAHFAFSYGSLKDGIDTIFNMNSMNIMGGLNYKYDITADMYIKARLDIFYFLNQVQTTMTSGNIIKPNNLGFGGSVAYGKEWDFDSNGILGLEVALDYKGLMGNAFNLTSYANTTASYVDSYDKALYNMLYVDLGLNYDKYFESSVGKWGLDTGLGIKGNITANALAKSRVSAHNNARITNMTLDNDRFIAYLNIGGSYLLESKDFDMEFSLAYYGNYGDRTMSNAGSLEWRVYW